MTPSEIKEAATLLNQLGDLEYLRRDLGSGGLTLRVSTSRALSCNLQNIEVNDDEAKILYDLIHGKIIKVCERLITLGVQV